MSVAALCEVIPDGVVAFFPSHDYLEHVLAAWKRKIVPASTTTKSNSNSTILSYLEQIKPVFYETQQNKKQQSMNNLASRNLNPLDTLLYRYSEAINGANLKDDAGASSRSRGALLLSVMGGSLSEGINFSDRLGRGVIVIGLPFPNAKSAVWQAKIQHVENAALARSHDQNASHRSARAKMAGREFYENACMRTVNQCIGRAIRHANDYAAIVLLDRRYRSPRIQQKLPGWIQSALCSPDKKQYEAASDANIGQTTGCLQAFFQGKGA